MQQEGPEEVEVKNQEPVEDPVEQEASEETAGEVVVSEVQKSEAEQVLEAEVAEWKEHATRAAADLDNFRKRMAREMAEALRYANQALLEELLPVLDNFEMGLQAAAAESESMIYKGMEMVKKQLDDFLGRQGVEEVPAEGQPFDPNLHEAVSQEECADTEEGNVLRVIRRGYKMTDRLLRPANVVVAKAPEAAAAGAEEGEG